MSKMYRTQVESANGQLMMIEEQVNLIESTKNQNDVFKVLEEGNKALKALQDEVSVEKMEQIREDIDMNKEKHNELSEFFQRHKIDMIENDEQLDQELEMLSKQEADKAASEFPVLKPKKEIEDEMKKEEQNAENGGVEKQKKKEVLAA